MTSHHPTFGDRQSASTSYDPMPVAVFPDGSVMWEQSDADPQAHKLGAPASTRDLQISGGMKGVVLGVTIALISTGFGAVLPRVVNSRYPTPVGCSQAPRQDLEYRSPRSQALSSHQCDVPR